MPPALQPGPLRLLRSLVVVLMLAGCVNLATPEDEGGPTRGPPEVPTQARGATPAPATFASSRPIAVEIVAMDAWVRPGEPINATARAPAASSFAWFLANRNPLVPGAEASTTFGQKEAPRKLAPTEVTTLPASRALRHVYGLDSGAAWLNVTLQPSIPPSSVLVRLAREEATTRFWPDDLVLGVGSQVEVRNDLDALVTLQMVDVMLPLTGGSSISVAAPLELGDYDLVLVAQDGAGGRGEASARLIVDKRKPDEVQTLGPYRGSVQRPALGLPGDERATHEVALPYDAREGTLRWNATSEAPLPAALRVRLLDPEGADVFEPQTGTEGEAGLAGLAKGSYRLVVESTSGVAVSYQAEARVRLALVPPASFFNT